MWKLLRSVFKKPRGRGKRSLSFSSEVLLNGSFPDKSNCCQPNINALFYVKKCPSSQKLIEKFESLMILDRFRSGAKKEGGNWILIDLANKLDIEKDMLVTLNVNSEAEIKEKVNELCVEEFVISAEKPLWKAYRFVNGGSGKSALLIRVHHVIGDGIALVGSMTKLFEDENGDPFQLDIPEKMGGGSKFKLKFGVVFKFLKSLFGILWLPNSKRDSDVSFCADHSDSKKMGTKMQSVEFPTLRLDFVKEIKNKARVTVNDVLMSLTSGMIRRYSAAKNDGLVKSLDVRTRLQVRALLPVAFPRPKKDLQNPSKALRNQWSLVSAPLAVNEITSKDRLAVCARATRRLKKSPTAFIQLFLQNNILSLAPSFFTKQIAFDLFTRHSIVFSNLPGPSRKIKICGEDIEGLQIIFPNLIPQVIVLSYNGGVFFNLCIDSSSVDVDLLPKLFLEEAADLAQSLGINCTESDMIYRE